MAHFAFLAPVGPFAGLSNGAKQKIAERFPALSIVEIESAAASFQRDLQAPGIEPRLSEAREELNMFRKELARFHGALNRLRQHRINQAIGEASRMISGQNAFEDLERVLDEVGVAIRQTSRALPLGRPELASRRLIATIAGQMTRAGLPLSGNARNSLLGLVDLIFEDLMVGGDAAGAVREWQRSQAARIDQERASMLLELVPQMR